MSALGELRDYVKNAFVEINPFISEPLEHVRISHHQSFGVGKRFSIPANGTVNIGIDTTGVTSSELVLLPIFFKAQGAGPININSYIGSTFTGGIEFVGADRNLVDSVIPKLKVYLNPTVTIDGVLSPVEDVLYSNGTPAVATLAGNSSQESRLKLIKGIKYTVRLVNQENVIADAYIATSWFEI